ncbi:MAG TPA: hypothetical protein PLH07_01195 [Sulfurovum sp.]|jgi:hypothetical protein|nr:MAG: hypothetical protein B7Y63_00905 [Sulfurovum sp. 35-42-20]OYY57216.1 MAG: hypothetical protein B7Y52_01910 [Sulfurovum sp. 28-43-6]OYZ26470.1 MAG: hypothetical protein B7Y23_01980 [Sulfurovum sp. 16-42-52]OYZ50090.1 MAG: hypothetical protein B7Y13_02275 [Sulfurovum sp. 24-42-9]OZA46328.1 MAG: hypothetical protein B7X80_02575 [Sulfurovum sp. 17-42-90]OZA60421.1 MAG: hypothetical protein B7X69_03835 [Sulfurovum sp. 39-42-12]HQR73244.1 hypothetical protein [Sulfurovum sp.]
MLRVLVVILLFLSTLCAASYQIRLGTFESYGALQSALSKLQNPQYKQKLSIEQDDATGYTLYSKTFTQHAQAQEALAVYAEVFEGAVMTQDGVDVAGKTVTEQNRPETVDNQEQQSPNTALWGGVQAKSPQNPEPRQEALKEHAPLVEKKAEIPLPKQQKNLSFAKELQRKVFYLCYEGKRQGRIKPVIKAIFNQKFITYSSQMMEIPPIITPYRLVGNDLHVTVGMFSVGSTKSRLERVTESYLRVINWADGKPVQPVRFYFKQQDAVLFSRKN